MLIQTVAVDSLAQELGRWGCVVVAGPPSSGKTTAISAAIRLFQRQSIASASASTRQPTPSTGYKSSSRSHLRGRTSAQLGTSSSRGHSSTRGEDLPEGLIFSPPSSIGQVDTISVDEVDESNIEVLSSGRRLVDRHLYTLRPEVSVVTKSQFDGRPLLIIVYNSFFTSKANRKNKR